MGLTDAVSTQQMVRFRISSDIFLTPVATIDEVADPVEYTPLPATVGWFKGLATIKGRLIPVSDLGDFSGVGASGGSDVAKWLVVNAEVETFAVIVDEVLGLVSPEIDETPSDERPNRESLAFGSRNRKPMDSEGPGVASNLPGTGVAGDSDNDSNRKSRKVSSLADLSVGSVSIDGQTARLVDLRGLLDVPAFVAVGSTSKQAIETAG